MIVGKLKGWLTDKWEVQRRRKTLAPQGGLTQRRETVGLSPDSLDQQDRGHEVSGGGILVERKEQVLWNLGFEFLFCYLLDRYLRHSWTSLHFSFLTGKTRVVLSTSWATYSIQDHKHFTQTHVLSPGVQRQKEKGLALKGYHMRKGR